MKDDRPPAPKFRNGLMRNYLSSLPGLTNGGARVIIISNYSALRISHSNFSILFLIISVRHKYFFRRIFRNNTVFMGMHLSVARPHQEFERYDIVSLGVLPNQKLYCVMFFVVRVSLCSCLKTKGTLNEYFRTVDDVFVYRSLTVCTR